MKEQINISNYEAYFLDDLEGNLSEALQKELETFLMLHPELKAELDEMREIEEFQLPVSEIAFDKKETLKKTDFQVGGVSASTFGDHCIADIEGVSTTQEKDELKSFIQKNDWADKEYKLYANTKVNPDKAIVYPHKKALYRKTKVIAFYQNQTFWKGVAAAAILLIGLFTVFNQSDVSRVYELRKSSLSASTDLTQKEDTWNVLKVAANNMKERRLAKETLVTSSVKSNDVAYPSIKTIKPNKAEEIEIGARKYDSPIKIQVKTKPTLIQTSNHLYANLQLYSVQELNEIENELLANYQDEPQKSKFAQGLSSFRELIALGKKELSEKASDVALIEKKYDKDGALEHWAFRVGSISVTHQVK